MSEKRLRNEQDLAARGGDAGASPARPRGELLDESHDQAAPSRSLRALDREQQTAGAGAVQAKAAGEAAPGRDDAEVRDAATRGVSGAAQPLPHADRIQASFGKHDVSHVQAHVGGEAATAAASMGASAYATGDRVAFAQQPDLHLAAHEAAHVVQQRAGVSLKGGVGSAGDPYEHHADAVADAVVAGRSAEALLDSHQAASGGTRSAVQRFGSAEHQELGNVGSGGEKYAKGGLSLDHGDLTMLRGDYFEEQTLLDLWNTPSPFPGRLPGTQDEVIYAIKDARSGDPRFQDGGPWAEYRFSDRVKKAVDDRYILLASKNTDHFVDPRMPGFGRAGYAPGSAPATYRDAHERALAAAYDAGVAGRGSSEAMITEAMGQHFLTDSFAAGHLTTPRGGIIDQWHRLYPRFAEQFSAKLVEDLADTLSDQASLLSDAIPASTLRSGVKDMLQAKIASKPPPSLGHIFSLICHDYDNTNGVDVVNDLGWRWRAHGDGHLGDSDDDDASSTRSHKDVALAAVAAGTDEVRLAHSLGRSQQKTPMGHYEVYDQIRQQVPSPATPSDRFAPEQYLPRPDPTSKQGDLNWQAKSLEEAWNKKIRSGASPTFGKLVVASAIDGEIFSMLDGIKKGLPEKINPFREIGGVTEELVNIFPVVRYGHGHIFPQKAFDTVVMKPLHELDSALRFLLAIVKHA